MMTNRLISLNSIDDLKVIKQVSLTRIVENDIYIMSRRVSNLYQYINLYMRSLDNSLNDEDHLHKEYIYWNNNYARDTDD